MNTTTTAADPRRICWKAAYLLTSDDPEEIRAGARLGFSLPRIYRAEILKAIEYYTQEGAD